MNRVFTLASVVWRDFLRRKDLYVLFILLGVLFVALVSVDVFGLGSQHRYVLDTGLLFTWIFAWLIAVSATARQLPDEEARGTIFPLLAKPVSRLDVVLGKWLGCWITACAATVSFYGMTIGLAALRGAAVPGAALAQALLLHLALLAVVSALALALSTRLNRDAATTLALVVSLAAFGLTPELPAAAAQSGIQGVLLSAAYYALPHVELFDLRHRLVHGWGAAPWGLVFATVLYGVCWTGALLTAAWLSYRSKRFRRGAAG